MAVQGAGAVGAGGGGGAVGVQAQYPAPAVDRDLVVEPAERDQIMQGGRPAEGSGDDVWWMSQTVAGWSQPGKAQCGCRVVAARRRWAGMVSVAAPVSSPPAPVNRSRPGKAHR